MTENTARFWMYHPSGVKVEITDAVDVIQLFKQVEAALAAGFLVNLPGMNDGEQVYQITHVARRTQKRKDGSTCPLIDLYHDGKNFSALKTWLDTPEQVADFERATSLNLANVKPFPGTAAIKRGESSDADAFVITLSHPVKAVWMLNPDYEEGSTSQSKRNFIRFDTTGNQPKAPAPNVTDIKDTPATVIGEIKGALDLIDRIQEVPKGSYLNAIGLVYNGISDLYKDKRGVPVTDHMKNSVKKLETDGALKPEHTVDQAIAIVRDYKAKQPAA